MKNKVRTRSSDFILRFILVSHRPHPCRGIKPLLPVGVTLAWRAKQKIKIQVTRCEGRACSSDSTSRFILVSHRP